MGFSPKNVSPLDCFAPGRFVPINISPMDGPYKYFEEFIYIYEYLNLFEPFSYRVFISYAKGRWKLIAKILYHFALAEN